MMLKKVISIVVFQLLVVMGVCASASAETINIGLLLDQKNEKTIALNNRLQKQIKAVVGEDATIVFPEASVLVNDFNLEKAQQNYEQLMTSDIDIIIAFGIVNNQIISQLTTHQKPTILFGRANQELSQLNTENKTSGINNFTYLVESASYTDDLTKLQQLTKFNNVAILVDQQAADFLDLAPIFDQILAKLTAKYKLIPITTVAEIKTQLDDVDAVYVAGGFFLSDADVKALADFFIANKLPSFSLNGVKQVELGMMASHSNSSNIDQFFRRIALTVERYIAGTPLADMPVNIDFTHKLTMNFNTADAIGVPIKYSLIADTDFVGEVKNMVSKKQYDLKAVIAQAIEKNRGLASSRLNIALQAQKVKTAKSDRLPDISAGVGLTHIDSDTAKISNGNNPEYATSGNLKLSQLIYSEGVNANIDIQDELKLAEQENYNADELDIVFNVANSYYTTLILKSNLTVQLQNLALTKDNLNLAKQSFEIGQANKTDMLRFKSQKAQNTQALVEANNELEKAYINLNQLLYNPIDYEIDVEDIKLDHETFEDLNYEVLTEILDDPKLTDPFIAYLVKTAKDNSPELKALAYNINATDRQIKRNGKRRYLPTVSLQAQYNRTFNRYGVGSAAPLGIPQLDDNHNVGVNISVPLFNKNLFNINRQQAMLQKQQLEVNKENVALSVDANVHAGVLNLINQVSNIELSKVSEQSAKESLELTQVSYKAGAVTFVQLIDAQNNYLQAQLAKNNAIYNFIISSLQLQRYIGYYFLLNSKEKNQQFKQQFFDYLNTDQALAENLR